MSHFQSELCAPGRPPDEGVATIMGLVSARFNRKAVPQAGQV
jgi:hypothetical protein